MVPPPLPTLLWNHCKNLESNNHAATIMMATSYDDSGKSSLNKESCHFNGIKQSSFHCQEKTPPGFHLAGFAKEIPAITYSRAASTTIGPGCLTAVFGMGTGVT